MGWATREPVVQGGQDAHPTRLDNLFVRSPLHKQRQRDLEIVDRNKIILADVVAEDIGTQLDHDRNHEVGKTIHDGIPRIYIESILEYPNGIQLIAVAFKTSSILQGK